MTSSHGGNIKEISEKFLISSRNIIDFSANINPLGYSEKLLKMINENFNDILHYPDIRYKELKEEIAKFHQIKTNQLYLGNGAADVIYSLASVLRLETLLVLAPTFSEYEDAFAQFNTKITYFKTEENKFQVNVKKLIERIGETKVDGICLCNPNNPTGTMIPKEDMKLIMTYCKEKDTALVIDEAFMDFVSEDESFISEINHYPDLFILRSLTKIFAIPGLRLGYLVTNNQDVLKLLDERAVPWRINCFAEMAGKLSLKDKNYLKESICFVKEEKRFLEEEMKRFDCLDIIESSCNYIFFNCLKEINLQEEMLKFHILIRNCSNYKGLRGNYYRVAVRTREENKKLISGFEELFYGKNSSSLSWKLW